MWGDPGFVDRWMDREARSLNAGIVTATRTLAALLQEEHPACTARDGGAWPIDRGALERLAAGCGPGEAEALRVPISLRFVTDLGDACTVTDPLAAEVLRRAEGFGPAYPFRDGRMVLPASLGVDLVSRYGDAIQQVFL